MRFPITLRALAALAVLAAAPHRSAQASPRPDREKAGCLRELARRGVAFVPLRRARGVRAPVRIEGAVGGVEYVPTTYLPLVLDCRFALVLVEVGPLLRRRGVRTLEFSIAHAYRHSRSGRLSLHANGLALDVHGAVLDDDSELSVQKDFVKRLGVRGCLDRSRPLNSLACALRTTGLFSELLTPDDDADHADHLHIGIAR